MTIVNEELMCEICTRVSDASQSCGGCSKTVCEDHQIRVKYRRRIVMICTVCLEDCTTMDDLREAAELAFGIDDPDRKRKAERDAEQDSKEDTAPFDVDLDDEDAGIEFDEDSDEEDDDEEDDDENSEEEEEFDDELEDDGDEGTDEVNE